MMNIMLIRKNQPLNGDSIIAINHIIIDDDSVELYRGDDLRPFKEFKISDDVTGIAYVSNMPGVIVRHGTYESIETTLGDARGSISRSFAPYIEILG